MFSVSATGGGAYKYQSLLEDLLGRPCEKADELESLIRGITFLQEIYPNECYTFIPSDSGNQPRKVVIPMKQSVYPFILVNIGSGVSILKVTSENVCERVGGCPMGGGTFFGLARLLAGGLSFDEALKQAGEGNNKYWVIDDTVTLDDFLAKAEVAPYTLDAICAYIENSLTSDKMTITSAKTKGWVDYAFVSEVKDESSPLYGCKDIELRATKDRLSTIYFTNAKGEDVQINIVYGEGRVLNLPQWK